MERRLLSLSFEMREAYKNLLNQKSNTLQGTVLSARPLKTDQIKKLGESLKGFFKKEVELESREDASLMGGFRVRAGGYVFDDTFAFHLKSFQKKENKCLYLEQMK